MERCAVATTVSPTYAAEIAGNPAIAPHLGKMFGVRNGVDMDIWDPSMDRYLPVPYDAATFDEGKARPCRTPPGSVLYTWRRHPPRLCWLVCCAL